MTILTDGEVFRRVHMCAYVCMCVYVCVCVCVRESQREIENLNTVPCLCASALLHGKYEGQNNIPNEGCVLPISPQYLNTKRSS